MLIPLVEESLSIESSRKSESLYDESIVRIECARLKPANLYSTESAPLFACKDNPLPEEVSAQKDNLLLTNHSIDAILNGRNAGKIGLASRIGSFVEFQVSMQRQQLAYMRKRKRGKEFRKVWVVELGQLISGNSLLLRSRIYRRFPGDR